MKTIKIDLPYDLEKLELHVFADEHVGDKLCDMQRLTERIEAVKQNPNAYCILNGDLMDNATATSIGDTYAQEFNPMEQLSRAVELFGGIRDKIICVTHGNHENRTYKKEGIDLSYLIAQQLGISDKYTPTSALLFIRFGKQPGREPDERHMRKQIYTVYVLHGAGGGRKAGAKANRLEDMAAIVDADIYIHSHTHLPMVMKKGFYRSDRHNFSSLYVDKLFVNTAANLNYGGYGAAQEFSPNSKHTPIIILDGRSKRFSATL